MRLYRLLMIALLIVGYSQTQAQEDKLIAFPGAEGFGRYTTGGRGGKVYHVTTLEDNGKTSLEGSLRWANAQSGPRTIVFDVSGTIMLKSGMQINKNTTLAGQTAPGDGICIADYPVTLDENVIVRYVRFRLGNEALKTNPSAHEGDGLGAMDKKNIIVDHCSVSWSIDECLSVYGSKDITVQWCIASQSLVAAGHSKGNHGYGGNWGGSGASYHHNLIAHHTSRTPRLGPRQGTQTDERMDLRNNVIYNWGGNGCYGGEGMNVNIVNNYYKPGPGTKNNTNVQQRIASINIRTIDYCLDKETIAKNYNAAMGTTYTKNDIKGEGSLTDYYVKVNGKSYVIDQENNTITVDDKTIKIAWNGWKTMLHKWAHLYVDGNVNPKYSAMTQDNWTYGIYNQVDASGNDGTYTDAVKEEMKLTTPITYEAVTTHTAEKAYEQVLKYAGASLHRDALDDVIISDTQKGEATYTGSGNSKGFINSQDDAGGWPTLNQAEAKTDTDGDGMPDEWETGHSLNPNDKNDGNQTGEGGYTNLEIYLNSLVAHITEAQNKGGEQWSGQQTTGIKTLYAGMSTNNDFIYNLQGVRVTNPGKGIYIQNGKKYIK